MQLEGFLERSAARYPDKAALVCAKRRLTYAQLLDQVHGVSFESYERSIDAHIKNIRKKIEPDPRRPSLVLTAYGVGYRFADA